MKSYLKKSIALILSLMVTLNMMPSLVFALDEPLASENENAEVDKAAEDNQETAAVESSEEDGLEDSDSESSTDTETVKETAPAGEKTEEAKEDTAEEVKMPAFNQSKTSDGVKITVKAAEGIFPEGAYLDVRKATEDEAAKTDKAVELKRGDNVNVALTYTFDIKVLDKDGKELQPADGMAVNVSFETEEVADSNLTTDVYHVIDKGGTLKADALDVKTDGDTASASIDGFSYYTVEFTYNSLTYNLDGNSEVALSDILDAVGLVGTATAAVSSDSEAIEVVEEEGNFTIKSKKFFTESKTLTVTIDGTDYEITVTGPTDFTKIDNSDIWWKFDSETGTLTVTGSGPLPDFTYTTKPASWKSPWKSIMSQVQKIEFAEDSNITSIGQNAFIGFKNITSIEIPKTVTSIGQYAFYRVSAYKCTNLKSVTFEEGSVCKSIGNYAFEALANLEHIDLPDGLETIGKEAFNGTTSLQEEIVFPNTIRSIGDSAFNNSGITGVRFSPASDPILGINVFYGCTKLETVDMGGTTSINAYDFYRCTALKTFIGEEVRTMDHCSLSKNSFDAPRISLLRLPKLESFTDDWAFNLTYADAAVIGPKILENSAHSEFSASMLANLITNLNVNSDYTVELKPFIESKGTYTGQLFEATLKDPQDNIVNSDEWYYYWPNGSTYKYPDLSIYPDDRYAQAGRSYIEGWKYGISSSAAEVKCFAWRFGNDGMIEITQAASYPVEKASDHPYEALHQNFDDLSVIMFKGETSIAVKSLLGRASVPGMDSTLVEMISPGEWEKDPEKPEGEEVYYVKITNPESSDSSIVSAASLEDVGKECKFIANEVGSTSINFRMITAAINIISDESPIYGRAATRSVAKVEEAQASNPGPSDPFELRVHVIDAKTQDITPTSITLVLEGVNEEIGSIACTLGGQTLIATPDNMTLTFTGLKPDTEYAISLKTADNATGVITNGFKDINTRTLPKEDQEKPDAPTAKTVGTTSIELNPIDNGLYRLGEEGEWQDSPLFEGLEKDTEYVFYQKIAGDDTHNESPVSDSATIRTSNHVHDWTYAADGATITATCGNTDGLHEGELTATVTVVAPALKVYGGSESEEAMLDGGIDGVSNPAIVYKRGDATLDAAPKDAGTYTANITMGEGEGAATASVEYIIAKAAAPALTPDQAPTADELTYNGSNQTLLIAPQDALPEGYTMVYAKGADDQTAPAEADFGADIPEEKNAGPYYVWYYAKGDDNHTSTEPACIAVTIARKAVTVDATGYEGTFDEIAHSITVTVTDPAEGYTVSYKGPKDGDYSAANPEFTDPGEYEVSYKVTADNYEEATGTATVKIIGIDFDGIESSNYEGTYDGSDHGITVTVPNEYSDYTISYSESEDGIYSTEPITFKDVTDGPKTVYYKVSKTGYNNFNGSATVSITQKEVGLEWSNTAFIYNGQAQKPIATATDLEGEDVCTVTVTGEQTDSNAKTKTENYTATASALSNANYKLPDANTTTFTIAQKVATLTWTGTECIYNGNEQMPGAAVANLEDGDACKVTVAGAKKDSNVKAGEDSYTATATALSDGNYKLPVDATTEFTIAQKEITVNGITCLGKVYDGTTDATSTLYYEDEHLVGMVEGDDLALEATGKYEDADVGSDKTISITLVRLTGDDADNYVLAASGQQETCLGDIDKYAVNVTADNQTKVFGQPDPELTFTSDPETLIGDDVFEGKLFRHAGENVGEYIITAGTIHDHNHNYAIQYTHGVLTITQAPNSVTATIEGWTYGDNPKTPSATASFGADTATFTYSNAADGEYSDEVPATAGTWYVKATVPETDNYAGAVSTPVEFTIAQKEVGLEWGDTEFIYNGEAQKPAATATGLVDGDVCDVTVDGAQTDANAKSGTDSYTATAISLSNANYKLPDSKTTEFTIAQKEITITGITAKDKTYDGNTDAALDYSSVDYSGKVGSDDVSVTAKGQFDNKNVGTDKTVAISDIVLGGEAKDNYVLAKQGQQETATANINKKVIAVTAEDKSKTYGEDDPALTYTADELVTGDSFTGALERAKGEATGTYDINQGTLSAGDNYTINYTKGTFTINQATTNEVTASIEGWTYGDSPKDPSATATYGQDTVTFAYSDSKDGDYKTDVPKNAGTWYVKATVPGTTNYVEGVSKPVEFTIAQKEVGLKWGDTEFIYNGKAQKPKATATGLVDGDECDVIVAGAQIDANAKTGTDDYTATATGLSNDNYKLPDSKTTKFTIAQKEVKVTGITAADKTYDGNATATLTFTGASFDEMIDGDDLSVKGRDSQDGTFDNKNVGNGKTVTLPELELGGADAGNYTIKTDSQTTTTAAITAKEVSVTAEDKSKTYGEDDPALTYTADELVTGDSFTGALERAEGETAGTYDINQGTLSAGDNYTINYTKGTFTINQATTNEVTAAIEGWTYGDTPKAPSATATYGQDTVTFAYSDSKDGDYKTDVPKNAGTWYVKATVPGTTNYVEGVSKPVEFTIAQKEVGLEWSDTDFTYNGKPQKPKATATDLVDGDECDVIVVGAQTDANAKSGTEVYEAVATALSNPNYKLPDSKTTEFTIAQKEITITGITAKDKTYDGNTDAALDYSSVDYSGKVGSDDVSVTAKGQFDNKNAGTDKTVTISDIVLGGEAKDNYVLAKQGQQETATANINKKEIAVTSEDKSKTYLEDDPELTYTADELVTGDSFTGALERAKGEAAGTYDINQGTLSAGDNYTINYTKGTFTINQAKTNEVTASIEGWTYGDTPKDPSATATYGHDMVTFAYSDSKDGDYKTEVPKNAGTWYVKATVPGTTNYVEGVSKPVEFTIAQKEITITGITAADKTYDGNTDAALDYSSVDYSDKVGSDDVSVTAKGQFDNKNAGTDKTVAISNIVLGGEAKDNYVLAKQGQQETATANINKKEIAVTAEDKSKTYLEDDPKLTYTADELVTGDSFTGALERAKGEAAGTYDINQGTLSAGDNYTINYTKGTFTINQATTNEVTAAIEGWTYGDTPKDPSATATYGQDTVTFAYSDSKGGDYKTDVPKNAGTWYVKATVPGTTNYVEGVSKPVEFTIAKKEVGLEWADTEFTYNGEAQKPAATATGLVDGDECDVTVDGAQIDANAKSDTDSYTATATGLSNDNYKLPDSKTTKFTIAPKNLAQSMLSLDNDVIKSDGTKQGPVVTMTDEDIKEGDNPKKMAEGDDYTLSGSVTSSELGTHFFKIEGKGNYTGSFETSWVLVKEESNADTEKGVDGAGDVKIFVSIENNTEPITVDNFTMDFVKSLLTEEELARLDAGEDITIYVETIEEPKSDASLLDRTELEAQFKLKSAKDIRWFDIKVWKKIGTEAATPVHELKTPLKMSFSVPDEYENAPAGHTRTFFFGRAHSGLASIISETTATTVTVSSDKFSTYALAYTDTENPKDTDDNGDNESNGSNNGSNGSDNGSSSSKGAAKTGDSNDIAGLMALMFTSAGALGATVYRRRRETGK